MNQKNIEIICIIVVVILILVPYGWIIYSHPPSRTFNDNVSADQIKEEMKKAGITICDEFENRWSLSGAQGGMTYIISKDCNNPEESKDTIVHNQKFESEKERDAAIRSFNSQSPHGKPYGTILISGQYIILVQGHGHTKTASTFKNISQIT